MLTLGASGLSWKCGVSASAWLRKLPKVPSPYEVNLHGFSHRGVPELVLITLSFGNSLRVSFRSFLQFKELSFLCSFWTSLLGIAGPRNSRTTSSNSSAFRMLFV